MFQINFRFFFQSLLTVDVDMNMEEENSAFYKRRPSSSSNRTGTFKVHLCSNIAAFCVRPEEMQSIFWLAT